jgi:membrane fusion protein (multidrug efflux system)
MTTAIGRCQGTFSVPGTLEPYDHAKVMVNAQGKLASLSVDLGSRVTKGQVLGSLDVAAEATGTGRRRTELGEAEEGQRSLQGALRRQGRHRRQLRRCHFKFENAEGESGPDPPAAPRCPSDRPVSGTVVAKNVEVGEYVTANTAVVKWWM